MRAFFARLARMDLAITLSMAALSAIGVAFVYSVGSASWAETGAAAAVRTKYVSQAAAAAAGFAAYFALAQADYRKILVWAAAPLYALSVLALAAVLVFGTEINHARRWLWGFQPSEFAKVALILALAALFGPGRMAGRGFKAFLAGAAAIAAPAVLVNMEPDLGTVLVMAAAGVAMMLAARVWTKGMAAMLAAAACVAAFELSTVRMAEREPDPERKAELLARTGLRPHQIDRLRVFLFPDTDILGAGYHLRQAEISVGSGGLWGRGFGKGRQTQWGYMQPSKSISDFIFAALAEEAGFAGSATVLALYLAFLAGCVRTALKADDDGGRLIAAGAGTLVFCHVYENVAMNIGLMPITGLPLPFISYGRTSLAAFMALAGLVQSVAVHSGDGARAKEGG